jgi:hypothetical protein
MGDVIVDRRADQQVVDVDDHQEQPTTEAGPRHARHPGTGAGTRSLTEAQVAEKVLPG